MYIHISNVLICYFPKLKNHIMKILFLIKLITQHLCAEPLRVIQYLSPLNSSSYVFPPSNIVGLITSILLIWFFLLLFLLFVIFFFVFFLISLYLVVWSLLLDVAISKACCHFLEMYSSPPLEE